MMEREELSNIAVDENGNQSPLDLEHEYKKTSEELEELTIEFVKLRGKYERLEAINTKQSELLRQSYSLESKIKSLEGKVVTLKNQNDHYKEILSNIKSNLDKGMGL